MIESKVIVKTEKSRLHLLLRCLLHQKARTNYGGKNQRGKNKFADIYNDQSREDYHFIIELHFFTVQVDERQQGTYKINEKNN